MNGKGNPHNKSELKTLISIMKISFPNLFGTKIKYEKN